MLFSGLFIQFGTMTLQWAMHPGSRFVYVGFGSFHNFAQNLPCFFHCHFRTKGQLLLVDSYQDEAGSMDTLGAVLCDTENQAMWTQMLSEQRAEGKGKKPRGR